MQYEIPMKYVSLQRPCCIVMHVPLIGSVSLCGMHNTETCCGGHHDLNMHWYFW